MACGMLFFELGTLEATCVLGYLAHVPGHWISITPLHCSPEHIAMIGDSVYPSVFLLTGFEFAELSEAMALHQAETPDDPHGVWSAFRTFDQSAFITTDQSARVHTL